MWDTWMAWLSDQFGLAQQALFEHVVQPVLFAMGWGNLLEDAFDATGWLLVGLIQLLVMLLIAENNGAGAAFVHACGAGLPPRAVVTVDFEDEVGGKTRLTINTRLPNPAAKTAAAQGGYIVGWTESLDRLAHFTAAKH